MQEQEGNVLLDQSNGFRCSRPGGNPLYPSQRSVVLGQKKRRSWNRSTRNNLQRNEMLGLTSCSPYCTLCSNPILSTQNRFSRTVRDNGSRKPSYLSDKARAASRSSIAISTILGHVLAIWTIFLTRSMNGWVAVFRHGQAVVHLHGCQRRKHFRPKCTPSPSFCFCVAECLPTLLRTSCSCSERSVNAGP
jgi:hypothetical protein